MNLFVTGVMMDSIMTQKPMVVALVLKIVLSVLSYKNLLEIELNVTLVFMLLL